MKLGRMGGAGLVIGAVGAVILIAHPGPTPMARTAWNGVGLVLLVAGALFVLIDMLMRPR